MKKPTNLIIALCLALFPTLVFAVSDNGQNGNSSSSTVSTSASSNSSANGNTVQTQTQTSNQGEDAQIQTRTETQLQADVAEGKPDYSPRNEKATTRMSAVATAVEALIRVSAQISNTGIGDQIRTIAQTQTRDQDRINQSVDNAAARTGFAKFFIGANYKELKLAKTTMAENQNQIRTLQQLMTQLTNESDQMAIANQIIVLQQQQLELKDQLGDMTNGFSLFGWINRWFNKY